MSMHSICFIAVFIPLIGGSENNPDDPQSKSIQTLPDDVHRLISRDLLPRERARLEQTGPKGAAIVANMRLPPITCFEIGNEFRELFERTKLRPNDVQRSFQWNPESFPNDLRGAYEMIVNRPYVLSMGGGWIEGRFVYYLAFKVVDGQEWFRRIRPGSKMMMYTFEGGRVQGGYYWDDHHVSRHQLSSEGMHRYQNFRSIPLLIKGKLAYLHFDVVTRVNDPKDSSWRFLSRADRPRYDLVWGLMTVLCFIVALQYINPKP